jgi:hypothetical protein
MSQNCWYIKREHLYKGPFTFAELVDAAQRGQLVPTDAVREGSGPWRSVESVHGLRVSKENVGDDVDHLHAQSPGEWYWQAFGFEMGPVGSDEIIGMVGASQLTGDDKVRRDGEEGWRRVADYPELVCHEATTFPTSAGKPAKPAVSPNEPPDVWFYRWDEKVYGPVTWNELSDLFSHSNEVAKQARIRREDRQEWIEFTNSQLLVNRASANSPPRDCLAGVQILSSARRSPRAASALRLTGRLESLVFGRGIIAAAIALWISLNAGALYFLSDPYANERRCLADLHEIVDEARSLQAREASIADWKDFRKRANESLAGMVKKLKKTAGPFKPLHQQLLWAARDEVPRILGPKSRETEKRQGELEAHLGSVERAIGL